MTAIKNTVKTQGIPPLKWKNGKGVAQSDLEKADEFNGQFMNVFNKNEQTQVPLLDRSAPFMNDIAVSKDGVIKILKDLCFWAGAFLSVAWPTWVQLLVFIGSSVPVVLFDTPGISRCRSQHVSVESSSLIHHSIYL